MPLGRVYPLMLLPRNQSWGPFHSFPSLYHHTFPENILATLCSFCSSLLNFIISDSLRLFASSIFLLMKDMTSSSVNPDRWICNSLWLWIVDWRFDTSELKMESLSLMEFCIKDISDSWFLILVLWTDISFFIISFIWAISLSDCRITDRLWILLL